MTAVQPRRRLGLLDRVKRRLSKPTIIVESAEGSRFSPEVGWSEAAQENLERLHSETLRSVLQETTDKERTAAQGNGSVQRSSEEPADGLGGA
jgi:hypothetical protein